MNGVVLTGITLVQETLSALSLPGSSVIEKAVEAAHKRRQDAARDVLLEAISQEGIENLQFEGAEIDEYVQMMMRYAKAAEEGAARQNLKLWAQVIFGLKRNRAVTFDKFQSCANVLETLTRDEIVFLGRMYRYYADRPDKNDYRGFLESLTDTFEAAHAEGLAAALTRTGMLLPVSAYGTTNYAPSRQFAEVCELARFESVAD